MLDEEEINQHVQLLAVHRRTLAHSLRQHKALGVLAPAALTNGIHQAWINIAQIKAALRATGVAVIDESDDEPHELTIIVPTLSALERRNRSRMLEKVKINWIKGVLEKSLHNEVLIELNIEERPEAVTRPWDMVLQEHDQLSRTLLSGTKIVDVFDELGGELLILGAPGSGKTTMLLDLARDLIARAEHDEVYPIPVVFNLSSWAQKRKPLTDWLVDEFNKKYDIPKKIAKAWLNTDNVLPLLDGLDEVKQEHRAACVGAINHFRQEHGLVNIVVCSRVSDYNALVTPLRLQGAILVQSLTPQQIDAYLIQAGDQLTTLRVALAEDAILWELAQSPLMLSIMTLAYQGVLTEVLPRIGSINARRRHLFTAYIERMFARRRLENLSLYTQAQMIQYLIWMAQSMVAQSQTIFYIEHLQPDMLVSRNLRLLYRITAAFVMAGLFSLVSPIVGVVTIALNPSINAVIQLLYVMAIVFIPGLIIGGVSSGFPIKIVESVTWSWANVKGHLAAIMILAIVLGLFSWSIGASALQSDFGTIGFVIGILIGLVFGGVIAIILGGLGYRGIDTTSRPNQGVRRSIRNALLLGIVVGLFWQGGGILCFLLFGGITFAKHIALRLVLWYNGSIPWNYARFLDYCAERIFLRKVGGGYIFMHRMLMEYFAELETEQESNAPTPR